MRCPKCQYISFDSSDRCRNCGYEFVLAVDAKSLDLPIQTGEEAIGPLSDLDLSDVNRRASDDSRRVGSATADAPALSGSIHASRPISSGFDLPLFRDRDQAPLVTPPAVPRAPLSVRRSNPAGSRAPARSRVEEPELELEISAPFAPALEALPRLQRAPSVDAPTALPIAATAGSRIFAALVDFVILGAISMAVLYLTLKTCGLNFANIGLIPLAPFASFLLLVAGGYFTLFVAANGQTIGKMAAGLKVIPAGSDAHRVSVGHAVLRAAAYLASALPAGLGFLPALIGADRRAIHDRLAATRVVKA
jgi:uncharacterized RDD family membrane protein YckC